MLPLRDMLQTLRLILPVLVPSWRFFATIAPAPRIEYGFTDSMATPPNQWKIFRPRPQSRPYLHALRSLFFNAHLNETLFLNSCAERMITQENPKTLLEIIRRIQADFARNRAPYPSSPYFQFRLIFIDQTGDRLTPHVLFTSPITPCAPPSSHEAPA